MRVGIAPEGQPPMLVVSVQGDLGVLAVLKINGEEQPIIPLGPEHGWLQLRHFGKSQVMEGWKA
jgi:hypothetical protein